MVKKLFKHEIKSYRVLLLMYAIMLVLSIFGRVIRFFESDYLVYDIISGSTYAAITLGIFAMFILTIVLAIVRFYRNMFTGEGYLTFTLPVKPSSHLNVKLVSAVIFSFATVGIAFLCGLVLLSGDVLLELIKAGVYLLKGAYEYLGTHLIFYGVEFIIAIVIAAFSGMLIYYACMCIGQLFNKNRVLFSVLVYFGFNLISQIISTVFIASLTFVDFSAIGRFVEKNPEATVHIAIIGAAVIYAIIGVVMYIVCNHIINKRLNLE